MTSREDQADNPEAEPSPAEAKQDMNDSGNNYHPSHLKMIPITNRTKDYEKTEITNIRQKNMIFTALPLPSPHLVPHKSLQSGGNTVSQG